MLSVFNVTNTNDSGAGSLRKAINDSNATGGGANSITFAIPTTDPGYNSSNGIWSILPSTALPTISHQVILDATTQPGYSNAPLIHLRGDSIVGSGISGLVVTAGNSTIQGFIINRFSGDGIDLLTNGGDTIQGNYIGTAVAGGSAAANSSVGIYVATPNNTIGGTASLARNLISGNGNLGIFVTGSSASGNVISGNYIGMDVTGANAIPNGSWGIIVDGAPNTTIGGTASGAGNLISGNSQGGIAVAGSTASGTVIQGNLIGTDVTGTLDRGNTYSGVYIGTTSGFGGLSSTGSAHDNTVGGTASGARNVISGNNNFGVWISGSGASGNQVLGNYIGTSSAGTGALGNDLSGIMIDASAHDNQIGGTTAGARNVISANGFVSGPWSGIDIRDSGTINNTVQGNYIGTDSTGSSALGNAANGVSIYNNAGTNTIGGTVAGAGNLISGQSSSFVGYGYGVALYSSVGGSLVAGNTIGLNAAGTSALANPGSGILVTGSPNNTIGGTTANARNVISGNTANGIYVTGSAATGNLIEGNYIGTDATGASARANGSNGILITAGAHDNTIGGLTSTPGTGAGNVISGNTTSGISLDSTAGDNTVIQGNIIGLNAAGSSTLGGQGSGGITIVSGHNTLIGGTNSQARNVISGQAIGISLSTSGSTMSTLIQGNYVGTDVTGTLARGNGTGIAVGSAPGTIIGGTAAGAGNLISGNTTGVSISGISQQVIGGLYNAQVQGNFIGTNASGTGALANATGLNVSNANNQIGGATAAARNIISGNSGIGVFINGVSATTNFVQGNYIGTNTAGTAALGNSGDAVQIALGATNNTIGGTASGEGNVLAGSTTTSAAGVDIIGSTSTGNKIFGNFIGTNAAGTAAAANYYGVLLNGSESNVIGGPAAGARNVISGNLNDGILIYTSANSNTVQGNFIGTDVTGTAVLANGSQGVEVLASLSNLIGTNGDGVTDAAERNIISGNTKHGVRIDSGSNNNIVAGNYIGTDVNGTAAVRNIASGVLIRGGSLSNRIGTDANGTADAIEANVIAGNFEDGVQILDSGTSLNVVAGNLIGTNVTGTGALPNSRYGVHIWSAAQSNRIGTNADGVNDAAERNIISGGAQSGVVLESTGTSGNIVAGNYIGTNISGTAALGNAVDGVLIQSGASNNTIGGIAVGAGNVISGNTSRGVEINGTGTAANLVQGNYIGTDVTGALALGNNGDGISFISAGAGNTIGGTVAGAGNVISGNARVGIWVSASSSELIAGNLIGTNAAGTAALGNGLTTALQGIQLTVGSNNNTIGGTTAAARNVISGNGNAGVLILGISNLVQGNYIGTNAAGTAALANVANGVVIQNTAHDNIIGGTATGAGNVISGNTGTGILFTGTGANNNLIQGNYLGTDAAGTTAIGNTQHGIFISAGNNNNTIGGTVAGARNLIAGNLVDGVVIRATGTVVQGNYIGLNATGTAALGNRFGVLMDSGTTGNTIGGSAAGAGNVISGNRSSGVNMTGTGTSGNLVQGNYIGTNAAGTAAIANAGGGVVIQAAASNNIIGTNGDGVSDALERNVISGNTGIGINVSGSTVSNNVIAGNYIGLNATGTAAVANTSHGIQIAGAQNTRIGTDGNGISDDTERNVISGNSGRGIYVAPTFVSSLTTVDQLISGALPRTIATGTLAQADFSDVNGPAAGNWTLNNPIPGGGSTDYAVMTTGTINVTNAGDFTFALSGDDGGRLRIDGLDVIVDNTAHVFTNFFGTVTLSAGTHAFEWVGFQRGGSAGFELSVKAGAGQTAPITVANGWHVLGDLTPAPEIALQGTMSVTVYYSTPANQVVIAGNYIGTDAAGTAAVGNAGVGVYIDGRVTNSRIGTSGAEANNAGERNVISANGSTAGVVLDRAFGITVAGNYIGTNSTGTAGLANAFSGIYVVRGGNHIIGTNSDGVGDPDERNVIAGNTHNDGVTFDTTTNNIVAGNYIGVDSTGNAALGNTGDSGVFMVNSTGNRVGTNGDGVNDIGERNIISANIRGITINGGGSVNNLVAGNYIGTNAAGTTALGNTEAGVKISGGADNNTIGGTSAALRNVISGNSQSGVLITDSGTTGNIVIGNYIGTDATGTVGLGNGNSGVTIQSGASSNRIGTNGDGTGDAVEGNVISGNAQHGLYITGAGTINNVSAGNYIGLDVTGNSAIANGWSGIAIGSGAQSNRIGTNADGIADDLERNVVSGNALVGIWFSGAGTSNNTAAGNYVGLNAAGTGIVANGWEGVAIGDGATSNTVGTNADGVNDAAERNVISGNVLGGVTIGRVFSGPGTNTNIVAGNYIGTDPTGTVAMGNLLYGVQITSGASNNTIGGTTAATRNLISGNSGSGIDLASVSGNLVKSNFIGTNAAGTGALANSADGILIENASNNTIGDTTAVANLISGNTGSGVRLTGASTTGNYVAGNYIGTNIGLTGSVANQGDGVRIETSAASNTIGGAADNTWNVLSGNAQYGVRLTSAGNGNVVQNNYVGMNIYGANPADLAIPNAAGGILIDSTANTTVGGPAVILSNVIGGNTGPGVWITGAASTGNLVQGNYIGLSGTGGGFGGNASLALANTSDGVRIDGGASQNTVGGTVSGAGNIIGGNTGNGVSIASNNNTVQGNYIGTNYAGTVAVANAGTGILISSSNNTIGGTTTGARNVISGNTGNGIQITTSLNPPTNALDWYQAEGNANDFYNLNNGSLVNSPTFATGKVGQAFSFNGTNYVSVPDSPSLQLTNGFTIEAWVNPSNLNGRARVVSKGIAAQVGYGFGRSGGNLIFTTYGLKDYITTGSYLTVGTWTHIAVVFDTNNTANFYVNGSLVESITGTAAALPTSEPLLIGSGKSPTVPPPVESWSGLLDEVAIYNRQVPASELRTRFAGSNNTIQGNYIGTDATGTTFLRNANGIVISDGASSNIVGGGAAGARNVISGNTLVGVKITGVGTTANYVQQNYIGTNTVGSGGVGNLQSGVELSGGAFANFIGTDGNGTNDATEGNVISANGTSAVATQGNVQIFGVGTNSNVVAGNLIGVNAAGTAKLTNPATNVRIYSSASFNRIGTNGDNISDVAERNIISGAGQTGLVIDTAANNTIIAGNYIGTDITGSIAIANADNGVLIKGGSLNTRVGTNGTDANVAGERNVISGNGSANNANAHAGIDLQAVVTGTLIAGNYIGLNAAGTAALVNSAGVNNSSGIWVGSVAGTSGITIGGALPGMGNVISGNTGAFNTGNNGNGIGLFAAGSLVQGNLIGTNAAGTAAVGNSQKGIFVSSAAANIIKGNTISGNASDGINLSGTATLVGGVPGQTGTVSWYRADGTTNDLTGANNGAFVGTASYAPGLSGQAFQFDGTNYVQASAVGMPTGAADRTLEAWVKMSVLPNHTTIIAAYGFPSLTQAQAFGIGMSNDGHFAFYSGGIFTWFFDNSNPAYDVPVLNAWNHMVVSLSAGRTTMYLNGALIGTLSTSVNTPTGGSLYIGRVPGAYGDPRTFSGQVDELAVYNRGLSANEIQAVYLLNGVNKGSTVVQGNYIGTNATGTAAVANGANGISVSGSTGNIIGGTTAAQRNIISGNALAGVSISGAASTGNVVQGNYVGTNNSGSAAIANSFQGVFITSPNNTVGGLAAGAGNVIAGNVGQGVLISGISATGNSVLGNIIGLAANGTSALGNSHGVVFSAGASFNTVGGTTAAARNVISGGINGFGVSIVKTDANPVTGNVVLGNYIGTDVTGTLARGNAFDGVRIQLGATNNTIGGTVPGAGNLISGNVGSGVNITEAASTGNVIQGNRIGTNAAGTSALPNTGQGVNISTATGTLVGGSAAGAGNVIAGNSGIGIRINSAASGATIQGNLIGTNAAGTAMIANFGGIYINGGANTNTVGGTVPGARNVISGSLHSGMDISGASGNIVQGNYIGTDITGTQPLGNTDAGIAMEANATNNLIGADGSSAAADLAARNIISANSLVGVTIFGVGNSGNVVAGNYIGTDVTGTVAMGLLLAPLVIWTP